MKENKIKIIPSPLYFQEQFVGIVGKVGSGKSSIFSAILAEMSHVSGYIHVENLDNIALVTQEPWIQHATIRDNILFGQEFDHQKYEAVIDAVALQDDLKVRTVVFTKLRIVKPKNVQLIVF